MDITKSGIMAAGLDSGDIAIWRVNLQTGECRVALVIINVFDRSVDQIYILNDEALLVKTDSRASIINLTSLFAKMRQKVLCTRSIAFTEIHKMHDFSVVN